jgi:endonuclease IV
LINKDEDQYEHFKDSIYNFNKKGRSKDMVRSKFFDQKVNELKDEAKVSKIPAIEKTPEQNHWS